MIAASEARRRAGRRGFAGELGTSPFTTAGGSAGAVRGAEARSLLIPAAVLRRRHHSLFIHRRGRRIRPGTRRDHGDPRRTGWRRVDTERIGGQQRAVGRDRREPAVGVQCLGRGLRELIQALRILALKLLSRRGGCPLPSRQDPAADGRVLRLLQRKGQPGSQLVQVHIDTAARHGRVVQQLTAPESRLPEVAARFHLPVTELGERLFPAHHEPGEGTQVAADLLQLLWHAQQCLELLVRRFPNPLPVPKLGPRPFPAEGQLFGGPGIGNVGACTQDVMRVIAQQTVVAYVDGKHTGLIREQVFRPAATVVEVPSSERIVAIEKGSLHTAGPAVIGRDFPFPHQIFARIARHRLLLLACHTLCESSVRFGSRRAEYPRCTGILRRKGSVTSHFLAKAILG